MDELSGCIDQLEAEVGNGSACSRQAICNGEVGDNSNSHAGDGIIGCMKCHKDNAYEQVTITLLPSLQALHFKCLTISLHVIPY